MGLPWSPLYWQSRRPPRLERRDSARLVDDTADATRLAVSRSVPVPRATELSFGVRTASAAVTSNRCAHGVVQGAGDPVDSGVAVPVRRTSRMVA
jgi:hypothetical protein